MRRIHKAFVQRGPYEAYVTPQSSVYREFCKPHHKRGFGKATQHRPADLAQPFTKEAFAMHYMKCPDIHGKLILPIPSPEW